VSAALVLVSAVADDESPVATWVQHEGDSLLIMARDRAERLSAETRAMLGQAGANLVELRAGNAHLALGFDHWHEYVEFWFGDLTVYRLVKDRQQRVAEREALVASLTLAGHTVREQRDQLGASLGTIHGDQRRLGLVPDRPLPAVVDEPEPIDPYRGLTRTQETLARVAAQADRGLTSLELDAETGWPMGTASGHLSRLERGRGGRGGGLLRFGDGPLRERRLPYVLTDAGRALLDEVLAARDAAEGAQ
jgi:DNA-binding MarR family transcriptional regulator